ncbi:hypothetical protein ARMSODRAFT_324006 [Armillaria solidipes]|uniref:AAA-ATPase-like domain-containing protein n=1 Tax=Armillaria solidipes TaxID=1076256 RepID=A0A2H3BMH0_9AGAR|nr:hypothetical protein ARMSODRAFT_324006 [Armillaria solidipes]
METYGSHVLSFPAHHIAARSWKTVRPYFPSRRWNSSSSGLSLGTNTTIPLGVSTGANLLEMRRLNRHVFDNTPYIVHLEQSRQDFAMFCRPKRFGKSLLIDMLKSYHGVAFADSLEETFEGLHIVNKDIQKMVPPSRWFVIKFKFSPFTGHGDSAVQSFHNDLLVGLQQFWWLHRKWLQIPDDLLSNRQRDNSKYPQAAFRVTFNLVRKYMWENGTKAVNGVIYPVFHPMLDSS